MREKLHGLFKDKTIRVQNANGERFELTTRQPIDGDGWIVVFYNKKRIIGKWSLAAEYGWIEIMWAKQIYF